MKPLLNHQRIQLVDTLRGWALLGVTLLNFSHFYYWNTKFDTPRDGLTTTLGYIMGYIFSAKSWTLLSLLFGYGFSVFLSKNEGFNAKPVSLFVKRMLWLFVFALLNSLVFPGDILRDYAVLGILLLLFYRFNLKTTSVIVIVLLLAIPFISAYIRSWNVNFSSESDKLVPLFYSHWWLDIFHYNLVYSYYTEILNPHYSVTVHLVMFACMLTGVMAHRSKFFERIESNKPLIRRIFWSALVFTIVSNAILRLVPNARLFDYFRPGYLAIIGSMIVLASGICWLHVAGKMKVGFNYLSNMGRMTLTHYLTHCFLTVLLFSGAGLRIFNNMPYWFYLSVALFIYVGQVFISKWWLTRYNYGPAEWLWRRLTYSTSIANVKPSPA